MDLHRAHAFLAGHHQVRGCKPFVQGNVAALVQSADCDRERLAAGIALIEARAMRLALQESLLIDNAAMRADPAFGQIRASSHSRSLGLVMEDRI